MIVTERRIVFNKWIGFVIAMTVVVTSGCTSAQEAPQENPSAVLDCPSEDYWSTSHDFVADVEGDEQPAEALESAINPYRQAVDGSTVLREGTAATLVLDGRVIVRAYAIELPDQGWVVDRIDGCGSDTPPEP